MSETHTADLATRYRYRQEGRELERERILDLLRTLRKEAQNKKLSMTVNINALITLIKGEENA